MIIRNEKRRFADVTINGFDFTLDKKSPVPYESILTGYHDIYDAYACPSSVKVSIWNMWKNWFVANDGICTICSKNSNFFSIEGFVTDKETGKRYYAYITHTNNKLYEVER